MSGHRFNRAPVALRRARLDNLVLVPGSQLPYKAQWQELANTLPQGSTLIVLPSRVCAQRRTLQIVADSLRAKGIAVTCHEVARKLQQHAS